jgi:hypothetical protein
VREHLKQVAENRQARRANLDGDLLQRKSKSAEMYNCRVSGRLRSSTCLGESSCFPESVLLFAGQVFWDEDQNGFEGAGGNPRLSILWCMRDH